MLEKRGAPKNQPKPTRSQINANQLITHLHTHLSARYRQARNEQQLKKEALASFNRRKDALREIIDGR